ncbi:MAG: hypothetical protein GXP42_00185 [Chloroflexi bacterium]|nr:hypothetical protein [Chloroflexota bacterium]
MHRRFILLLLGISLLTACAAPPPPPTATPTPVVNPAAPRDRTLLDFERTIHSNLFGGSTYCEARNGAALICAPSFQFKGGLGLTVRNVGGNAFALWRTDLIGDSSDASDFQAIGLRVSGKGRGLRPHLYLVDQDGRRAWVDLSQFVHLRSEPEVVYVPLRWFRDAEGNSPDFSRLAEFQIAFEWEAMEGTLNVDDVRFVYHVQKAIERAQLPAAVSWPAGFRVTAVAEGFSGATTITFGPEGHLWLSQQRGNVWKLEDGNGDGRFERASLFASGFTELLGLLWHPQDGTLYASSRATITALRDEDGDGRADVYTDLVTGLPWGRHQNNSMVWGPDGMLYFGLGSGGDISENEPELMATILRLPHLGGAEDLEIVARGVRNAYDLAFNARGDLFATENGPDYNDAPDELNHIIPGEHYGYPYAFGDDDGGGRYRTPIWLFEPHASADGLVVYEADQFPPEYRGNLFAALFGQVFGSELAGHRVDRIIVTPNEKTYAARGEPFLTGLDRPLDVTVGPDGALYVLEYVNGAIYRVDWVGGQ